MKVKLWQVMTACVGAGTLVVIVDSIGGRVLAIGTFFIEICVAIWIGDKAELV